MSEKERIQEWSIRFQEMFNEFLSEFPRDTDMVFCLNTFSEKEKEEEIMAMTYVDSEKVFQGIMNYLDSYYSATDKFYDEQYSEFEKWLVNNNISLN